MFRLQKPTLSIPLLLVMRSLQEWLLPWRKERIWWPQRVLAVPLEHWHAPFLELNRPCQIETRSIGSLRRSDNGKSWIAFRFSVASRGHYTV
jgi:hypothetical protein